LRLNPVPLDQGACLRGYHPHRRASDHWHGYIGKREFIRRNGREAWAALPHAFVLHDGHRKRVSRETELDRLWMLPPDHPMRRAIRKGDQWIMPCYD
jgi:hypothetical protein